MSFGEKILLKYGYEKGKGLGKNENGIKEAIKANFKFDQAGLGSHESERKSDHWWQRSYTEAASNIKVVNSNQDDISIQLLDSENRVELTNKSYSVKKLKKQKNASLKYGSFLKSSTLLANEEKWNDDYVATADIELKPVQVLDDDELFRVCGGRTAHKSARHGLKLEGKLKRVAEQEKEFLEKMKNGKNETQLFAQDKIITNGKEIMSKKSVVILNSSTESMQNDECKLPIEDDNMDYLNISTSKRKRKREKQTTSQLASIISVLELNDLHESSKDLSEVTSGNLESQVNKKKKKKDKKDPSENLPDDTSDQKRKKRKRKKQSTKEIVTDDHDSGGKSKKVKLDSSEDSHDDKIEKINRDANKGISNEKTKKSKRKKSSKRKLKKESKEVASIFDKQLHF